MNQKERDELLIRLDERTKKHEEEMREIKSHVKSVNKWRYGTAGTAVLAVWAWVKTHLGV